MPACCWYVMARDGHYPTSHLTSPTFAWCITRLPSVGGTRRYGSVPRGTWRRRVTCTRGWREAVSTAGCLGRFELSRALGARHQAMRSRWSRMHVAADARWELESGLVMWRRSVLRMLPPR